MTDKVLNMIGISARAGKIKSGEFAAEKAIKSGIAVLVILAGDASDGTKKKFRNSAAFYHVPVLEYADKDTLGHAMGKDLRSVAAVIDRGLGEAIQKAAKNEGGR